MKQIISKAVSAATGGKSHPEQQIGGKVVFGRLARKEHGKWPTESFAARLIDAVGRAKYPANKKKFMI